AKLQSVADKLNQMISEVETEDPWVKKTFGVVGIGEGLVFVPGAGKIIGRQYYRNLIFKAKSEKHKANKTKKSVQIDPEILESIEEFTKMFATNVRFEQGMNAISANASASIDVKNIGQFLKWICKDV